MKQSLETKVKNLEQDIVEIHEKLIQIQEYCRVNHILWRIAGILFVITFAMTTILTIRIGF